MSKKMMLLALAVVSAAFFALPAMASAAELHYTEPEEFNISGSGGELRAEGEPTITCEGTGGTGKWESTTTGESTLDFTGCHTTVFGFTAKCKSETEKGADNTIASSGTFHLITISEKVPGILLTTKETVIVCAGISKITTTGSVIGTITSPECGTPNNQISLSFTASSAIQTHRTYTGKTYELLSRTGSGEEKKSALVGNATNKQTKAGTLDCT